MEAASAVVGRLLPHRELGTSPPSIHPRHLPQECIPANSYCAGQVSLVISTSLQSVGVSHGLGKHYIDITPSSINDVSFFSITAGFASILAASWSKTSFAISLLRISGKGARKFIWFVIVSVNLVFALGGTLQLVQCWPVSKQWTLGMEGKCLDHTVVQSLFTFMAGR